MAVSRTWVLHVELNKTTLSNDGKYDETFEFYVNGRKVVLSDPSKIRPDSGLFEAVLYVASAQESNDQDNSASLRINVFDALHVYAMNSGLTFSGLVTYDLFTSVVFEYTWVNNNVQQSMSVGSSAACDECGESHPLLKFDHQRVTWNPSDQ